MIEYNESIELTLSFEFRKTTIRRDLFPLPDSIKSALLSLADSGNDKVTKPFTLHELSLGLKILSDSIPTPFIELNFTIHYVTVPDERVVVTGNHKVFGNWDPGKGFELEWNSGHFWSSSILLADGTLNQVEYKYVCIGNNRVRWENGPNRVLDPSMFKKHRNKLIVNLEGTWEAN